MLEVETMANSVTQQIIRQLDRLSSEHQRRVLDFTQELNHRKPKGTAGKRLLRFAGIMKPDDILAMRKAIEEGCERVNAGDW